MSLSSSLLGLPIELVRCIVESLNPSAPCLQPYVASEDRAKLVEEVYRKELVDRRAYQSWPEPQGDEDARACQRTLLSLCLSSRACYEIAKPILYRTIILRDGRGVVLLLRSLLQSPALGTLVTGVSFTFALNNPLVVDQILSSWHPDLQAGLDTQRLPQSSVEVLRSTGLDWCIKVSTPTPIEFEKADGALTTKQPFTSIPRPSPRELMHSSFQADDLSSLTGALLMLCRSFDTLLVRLPLIYAGITEDCIRTPLDQLCHRKYRFSQRFPDSNRFSLKSVTTLKLKDDIQELHSYGANDWVLCFRELPNLKKLELSTQHCRYWVFGEKNTLPKVEELNFHLGDTLGAPSEKDFASLDEIIGHCPALKELSIDVGPGFQQYVSCSCIARKELGRHLAALPRLQSLTIPRDWQSLLPEDHLHSEVHVL